MIMAAIQRTWQCQKCQAVYCRLFDLVGHVRAAHSADCQINLTCQINGCPRMFKNTNTWYKHVRSVHKEEYSNRDIEVSTLQPGGGGVADSGSAADYGGEEDGRSSLYGNDGDSHESAMEIGSITSNLVSQDAAAGMLLKLKEKHKLSQAAVEEVIQVVGIITDHVAVETLSAVKRSAETHGIDMDSPFIKSLPSIPQDVSHPFSSMETAYRQQSYVRNKFPYVVSIGTILYL